MPKTSLSAKCRMRADRVNPLFTEPLETRQMLSVATNAAGYTVVTPNANAGDQVIYCSSSTGSDYNNGLSIATPVASLAAAERLMQNNTGDQLLLKAGDTWHTGFGYWRFSGASAADPMVIGAYGTGARPIIMSGTSAGIQTGASSAPEIDYLDIIGIHFWADGRDPSLTAHPALTDATGINFFSKSNDILIEDCMVQDYTVNINLEGALGPETNINVRRSVIVDSWSADLHSQGLYAYKVSNLTLQDNVFDHNGFNTLIPQAKATIYNHDCYISAENTGIVAEDNVFAEASATGLQDRPGGIVENNLFLNDPVGLTFGLVNGADTYKGGVGGQVSGNVFQGSSIPGAIAPNSAMQVGNIAANSRTSISNNVFTSGPSNDGPAILLTYGIAQIDPQDSVGINSLTISGNMFYGWPIGIDFGGGMTAGGTGLKALNSVTIANNDFENIGKTSVENGSSSYLRVETWTGNVYYNAGYQTVAGKAVTPKGIVLRSPFAFSAPTRTVTTFDALVGGPGTVAHYLKLCRLEAQGTWSWTQALTPAGVDSYVENGFKTVLT